MIRVSDVLHCLEEKAPCGLKLDFDNVGHLVGHADAEVSKIMVALDITDDVIDEALSLGADLIVSHHPLIFNAIKSVTDGTWVGSRIMTLCENRVAAICMHTNLDAAKGGVNDALLAALGAKNAETFDPVTDIGRVGELENECSLDEFLLYTKTALNVSGLRYYDAGKRVKRIACCGGSGGGEIALAVEAGCDTYVTADVKYDQFLEAKHLGINLIDADHFCTENVVVPVLKEWISAEFPSLPVYISQNHKQTTQFI